MRSTQVERGSSDGPRRLAQACRPNKKESKRTCDHNGRGPAEGAEGSETRKYKVSSRASGTDPAVLYRSQAENLVGPRLALRAASIRCDRGFKQGRRQRSIGPLRDACQSSYATVGPGKPEALKLEFKGCLLALELAHALLAMAGNRGFCSRSRVPIDTTFSIDIQVLNF
ncbi:hypothetical protein L1887_53344 [Cichorium endivia]|nr:hypothetical protein L1887_53344 [Cichorium endivia]